MAANEMEEDVLHDEGRDIQVFRVRFASGRKVSALSSRPSNLRGKQGRVVIDEAAFHPQLDQLLKAALALLMWGGRVSVISTHNGDDNPFNDLARDARSGRRPFAIHRITLDDALAEGLFRRICLRLGREWSPEAEAAWRTALIEEYGEHADEELFCVPARSAGQYLPRALVESCLDETAPVLRKTFPADFAQAGEERRQREMEEWLESTSGPLLAALPRDLAGFVGGDFGRTGDVTVFIPLIEDGSLRRRAPFIMELRNCPFKQQEQALYFICDRLPRFVAAALDARGIGMTLAEYAAQKYGTWRVAQIALSTQWYLENMPRYKAAFEDRLISLPRDADVLDDHRALRVERGVPRIPEGYRGRGRDGGQRHADSAIAGALAWYAAYALDRGPIEYQRVEPRRLVMAGAW
jgi:phage FluMu gp28-like protein